MDLALLGRTAYEDGVLEASVALHGGDASCAPGIAYHAFGFLGRPKDPDVDAETGEITNGPRVLYWYEGSTLHTVLLDDPRRTQKLPEVGKGGSMMYADADGAFVRYAPDGALEVRVPAGKAATIQVGAGAKVTVTDATVAIGDDAAVPLVKAAWATALATALTTLASKLTGAAAWPAVNAAGTELTTALVALPPPATTKAMGT